MRIDRMLAERGPVFSFEFFPPQTDEGEETLFRAIAELRELQPSFVSVTQRRGSTRTRTLELVVRIRRELGLEPMAHFTCADATVDELHAVLRRLRDEGLDNVLALRGDPPSTDGSFVAAAGGLSHSSELLALITANYDFCVGGACYPESHSESTSPEADLQQTRLKVDSGACFLITQLFFDNRAYFDFVARARRAGIDVPIIPGIMPITRATQVDRFESKMFGAHIPEALCDAVLRRKDEPEAVMQLGVAWSTLQCAELLAGGAPGVHFYTLNRSPATRAILSALQAARPWERAG
jgi:methylenetetrahydrofolate reductase (NADPH)